MNKQSNLPDLEDWQAVVNWPKSIIYPDAYDGGETLALSWDLGAVPDNEKKKVIQLWSAKLPELTNVRRLSLWTHVTQSVFDAACKMPALEHLQIKWSNLKSLQGIEQLQNLRRLTIGSSTKIDSLDPLRKLSQLKVLEIENFKSISDFSPLLDLTVLESLSVTGSMWSRQNLGSIEPFAKMTWLKSLCIDTSHISSIKALGNLKGLQNLSIGGRLSMEEYAWLSAKLPNTQCQWFFPYINFSALGTGPCEKCKLGSKLMLTGKGARILCSVCDKAKVEKYEASFEAAKAAAFD
ncbi:leucine-rich repeat domain-containing protein [Undibacterium sp. TC4M20W]|uniref:leucine-rich repeat domain-containing protein n=1 Tax=Undibacterium sp. TC4M20W TaxID=3413052 RepID=UPI003BF1079B